MSSAVLTSVLQCLHFYLPQQILPGQIVESADLQNDLGFDSLGLATVATNLHSSMEFDLQYFAENLGEIRLVSDFVRIVEEALLKHN